MRRFRLEWDIVVFILILIGLFWFRMALSTSAPALTYDSYLTVRAVEHIRATGLPLSADPLSITGAHRVASPVFDYLMAAFISVTPLSYRIIPNLFMVLLLIPVFIIARRLAASKLVSLLAVVFAASGPAVFSSYLDTPSATPIAACVFLVILAMLDDAGKNLFWIVLLSIVLTFLSPLIFIMVLALLAIIILLRVEGFGLDRRIGELFLFTLLLSIWFYVLVYKTALFSYGIRVIWQNLPSEFALRSFSGVTLLSTLYGLGVITFLFGTLGAYHALFEAKARPSYTVIGGILAVVLALIVRIVPVATGLMLLALLLSIMAGYGIAISVQYLRRTKTPWAVYPAVAIFIILFVFSAILPALSEANGRLLDTPSQSEIAAFQSLRGSLPADAVLLTTIKEAAAVQYFSGHRTVTDDDFLLVPNGDELVSDIDAVYTARFSATIVGKAAKLGFTDILFTADAAKTYGRERIFGAYDSCVHATFLSVDVTLYTLSCGGTA